MNIYITRRETFSASHRLYNENFTDEENERVFGKCSNPNGHGHNYILEVVVKGEPNKNTGYVIDLKILKSIIRENVIKKVDHKNLNIDVDFLKGIIPTAENIAIGIWNELKDKIPDAKLYAVKLYETENNYVEYKGE
ncbi:6-pyruvoyl tetrahydropterin synthase family protein [Melioribacteraceae bacterium 4301-Me]|uniref:6-pyruvoyl trahydropterin synthase family protein n=1 Tax=Pyranulibacter aquaticus TaxID=3163344 RepID=UPI003594DEDD